MTTIAFAPPPGQAFTTTVTLDGAAYRLVATWNVFGQRWYVTLYDDDNARVLTLPMVSSAAGSPDPTDHDIVGGYFASTLIYRATTGNLEVSP